MNAARFATWLVRWIAEVICAVWATLMMCLVFGGCTASQNIQAASMAVYLPNVRVHCLERIVDTQALEVEYRDACEAIFDGVASVNRRNNARRVIFVRLNCQTDPWGQKAFGRCAYFGSEPEIYGEEIARWVETRQPHATPRDVGVMLANITAHEVGHAAGMKHDPAPMRVMSTESGIHTFFEPWRWQ